MIIDSHVHAWSRWPYSDRVPDPQSRGNAEQVLFELDEHGIDGALVVAANLPGNADNNDYVARAVARSRGRLHQAADIDSRWSPTYHAPGAADRVHQAADRWPIVGVSHYCEERNDGWLRSSEADAFFRAAAARSLLVSLALTPNWQADLREVARRFPTVPVLCHHLGRVHNWEGSVQEGLRAVLPSAEVPNIHIKISGPYYGSDTPWEYPYPDAVAIVESLCEAFGPARLCWGSDYPVVRRAMTYRQSLEFLRSHCGLVGDVQGLVLGGALATALSAPPRSPSVEE